MKMTNSGRDSRGGDVPGTSRTDPDGGLGGSMEVAAASFDPGYDLDESLDYASVADLKRGYCTYGKGIGEKS